MFRKGKDYSRLRAATDLFDAFVNRTLAYNRHHVIGLVTFDTKVVVKLQLTEILSSLPVSLLRICNTFTVNNINVITKN